MREDWKRVTGARDARRWESRDGSEDLQVLCRMAGRDRSMDVQVLCRMAGRDIISLFSHRAGRQEGRDGGTDDLRDCGETGEWTYGELRVAARDIL